MSDKLDITYEPKIDSALTRVLSNLHQKGELPLTLTDFRGRFLASYEIDQEMFKIGHLNTWPAFKVRFYEAIKRLEGVWINSSYEIRGKRKNQVKIIDLHKLCE